MGVFLAYSIWPVSDGYNNLHIVNGSSDSISSSKTLSILAMPKMEPHLISSEKLNPIKENPVGLLALVCCGERYSKHVE